MRAARCPPRSIRKVNMNGSTKRKLRAIRARALKAEASMQATVARKAWRGYAEHASPVKDLMGVSLSDPSDADIETARDCLLRGVKLPWYKSYRFLINLRAKADSARQYARQHLEWSPADDNHAAVRCRPAVKGMGSGTPPDPRKPVYAAISPEVFVARNGHARPELSEGPKDHTPRDLSETAGWRAYPFKKWGGHGIKPDRKRPLKVIRAEFAAFQKWKEENPETED